MEGSKVEMEYRYLGNSGLRVSIMGFGNWLNSKEEGDYVLTRDCIKKMYDAGVNFYDTAEIYGNGGAEEMMGKVFKELNLPREELVVSTKIKQIGQGVNDQFLSRKHIVEGVKNSLKRLQLDYVDVIFCHRPDYEVPLEETCAAMHFVIEQGWAFYWGTSEWPPDRITQAIEYCDKANLHKPITEQPLYNMFRREKFEKHYRWVFGDHKYGSTVWSPLAGGLLTGKYNDSDGKAPAGTRFDQHKDQVSGVWNSYMGDKNREETLVKFRKLADYSKELGYSMAQLALAWVLASHDVSTAILGFTKVAQVEENLKAIELYKKWTPEIEKKILEIIDTAPETDLNWRTWKNLPTRREQAVLFK